MSQAIPGTAFAVTSASAGPFTVPASNNVYGWAVVNNCTPWLCQVICADGVITAQPFEAVLVSTPPNGNLSYTMSVPPSGSAVATAGQPVYLQADWYVQASGAPDGTYPMSLTAQAIAAAVTAEFIDTDLTPGGVPAATLSKTVTLPTNTQTIEVLTPSGIATTTCVVQGTTTSALYGGQSELVGGTRFRFRVSFAADPSVTVTVTAPGGSWWIIASPAVLQVDSLPYAVAGANNAQSPGFAQLVGGRDGSGNLRPIFANSAGQIEAIAAGIDGTSTAQFLSVTAPGAALPSEAQVVQAGSDGTDSRLLLTTAGGGILPGRPPGLAVATANATGIAAGGTSSVIPAVGGKTITVYSFDISMCVAAVTVGLESITLQGITSGTVIGSTRGRAMTAVGWAYSHMGGFWIQGGFPLSLGEGLQVVAAAGNAANVEFAGTVYYTQA